MRITVTLASLVLSMACFSLSGCKGQVGPAGDTGGVGPEGPAGASCTVTDNGDGTKDIACTDGTTVTVVDGTAGSSCTVVDNGDGTKTVTCTDGTTVTLSDGVAVAPAAYVTSATCRACHVEQGDQWVASGHPYKLNAVNGAAPAPLPNAAQLNFGNFPTNPPNGWVWADISYVIGGFGWKNRFVDQQGYIITCEKDDVDADGDGLCDNTDPATFVSQRNLENDGWVGYHAGEFQKQYSCGACHTTGYDADVPTPNRPGIVGSWSETGIGCEACHGPGSLHAANPKVEKMDIDRSAEQCGSCHIRGSESAIPAKGGFTKHHEQWNEMFSSKKHSMDCVDCHDPHQSSRFAYPTLNPDKGIRVKCESCHIKEAASSNSIMDNFMECVDCHMPYLAKSAVGDLATFTGDVRSHSFAINTDAAAPQFNAAGDTTEPYLNLDYACNYCHGVTASTRTGAELETRAVGYHD